VLAILAMLARQGACAWLRVAPLLPSPALRAAATAAPGRGGKAGSPIEQERILQSCAYHRPSNETHGSTMITAYVIRAAAHGHAGEETSSTAVTRSCRKLVDKTTAAREHSGEAMAGSPGNISG
jgi:hypothetical protein